MDRGLFLLRFDGSGFDGRVGVGVGDFTSARTYLLRCGVAV
jgi:hypothetical protein